MPPQVHQPSTDWTDRKKGVDFPQLFRLKMPPAHWWHNQFRATGVLAQIHYWLNSQPDMRDDRVERHHRTLSWHNLQNEALAALEKRLPPNRRHRMTPI